MVHIRSISDNTLYENDICNKNLWPHFTSVGLSLYIYVSRGKAWHKLLFLLKGLFKLLLSPGSSTVVTIQIAVMCVMLGMDTADS